jgi:thioredoxin 1
MKQFILALVLVLPFTLPAMAVEKEPFTPDRFAALQKSGALILIDVHASWCSTCAKQQAILDRFAEKHPEVSLHVLQVDFDKQKEAVRNFKAPRQSTLLLYRGGEQRWFSVAETREPAIFEAILQESRKQ